MYSARPAARHSALTRYTPPGFSGTLPSVRLTAWGTGRVWPRLQPGQRDTFTSSGGTAKSSAAVSSSMSLLEAVVAHYVDRARDRGKGDKRKPYSVLAGIAAGILCVIVCLDSLGSAGISPADILGMRGTMEKLPTWSADWLDFFDCIAEGILMPLGALLMSIMYGWEIGPEVVHAEATREGQSFGAYGWFKLCIKYITPLCMLLVLYGQIKEFFFV